MKHNTVRERKTQMEEEDLIETKFKESFNDNIGSCLIKIS